MNAKDCDSIAYILADTDASEEVREKFFALDPRIQDDWEAFTVVLARQRQATERFAELMEADFGPDWRILKSAQPLARQRMETALREVYGDDYHPSLLNR
ncbi:MULTISPECIES: hypothetical protein [Pseudomonas]|uniref:Uncharacterized protein n=1 Tax=Pseudomonas fluorescens TaxID=294 RepID=A0A161Z9N4_PSEFL|nr:MULTISPECIES: hypothetical protein [Pseudomonas]KZN20427.1 hypothetical protein A1D17_02490 [Pseudomonas fluorescens]